MKRSCLGALGALGALALAQTASLGQVATIQQTPVVLPPIDENDPNEPPRLGLKVTATTLVMASKSRPVEAVFGRLTPGESPNCTLLTMHAPIDQKAFSCVGLREGFAYCRLVNADEQAVANRIRPLLDAAFDSLQRDQDARPIAPDVRDRITAELSPLFAFLWWPIVATRGIVAGADGTDVIVWAKPIDKTHANVYVYLVEGSSCLITFTNAEGKSDQAFIGDNEHYIHLVTETNEDEEERVTSVSAVAAVPADDTDPIRQVYDRAAADFAAMFP